jgi:hypothetical protein
MKTSYYLCTLYFFLFLPFIVSSQITGTFTADNSYAVYIGNQNSVVTKVLPSTAANGHTNTTAAQIFSPTQNTFNASSNDYFYIIAWSDDRDCQGLIGEFTGATTIKTGDPGWQVYPTNRNYGNNQAPTSAIINQFITTANTSNGWLTPFVGPKNIDGKNACRAYRKVNGISDDAKWVWHNATGSTNAADVMGRGRNHKEFLIFRFPVKRIISGGTPPKIDECDCIPEEVFSVDLTSSIFELDNVSGPAGNFQYNLVFKPNSQYAALSTAWNGWINTLFGPSTGSQCQVIHQYILYEYTSTTPGVIATETYLEQFWSSPNYLSTSGNHFTTTLSSNKKYYIKHGVYYGSPNGGKCLLDKECPWQETRFFLGTSSGSTPKVKIMDSNGNLKKELSGQVKSKKF